MSASNPDSFGCLYLVWKTRPAVSYESDNVSPAAPSTDLEYLLATIRSCAPLHPCFPQCIRCGPCYRRLLPQPHSVGQVRSVARCKIRCLRHMERLVQKSQQLHKHLAIAFAILRSSFCTHKLQSSKADLSQLKATVKSKHQHAATHQCRNDDGDVRATCAQRRGPGVLGAHPDTQACCFSYIDAKYSNELLASDKSVGPFQAQ